MRLNQWTVNSPVLRTATLAALAVLCAGCVSVGGKDPTLRTPGRFFEDKKVERLAHEAIVAADERLAAARVKAVSYDGVVLLVGQVPDDGLRQRAADAIRHIPQIRRIHNELQIGGATSLVARANDDWLTTKVLSRFAASDKVNATRVKVVTEDRVVYLVGTLPHAEGDQAAEVARTVFGVHKVVKVFDYLGAP